jgi:hypothetical protein
MKLLLSVLGGLLLLASSAVEWVHFDFFGTPVYATAFQIALVFLATGDTAGLLRVDGYLSVGLAVAAAGLIGIVGTLLPRLGTWRAVSGVVGVVGPTAFVVQMFRLPELGSLAASQHLGLGVGMAALGGAMLVLGRGLARPGQNESRSGRIGLPSPPPGPPPAA